MKTTLKSLEKRIKKLEERFDYFFDVVAERLKGFDDKIEKLEKTTSGNIDIDKSTCCGIEQPKYKVGDYVHYFDNSGIARDNKIIKYSYEYNQKEYFVNHEWILESQIMNYAKPDLLTPEEKEYLSAVIKPFGRDLYITKLVSDDLEIDNKDVRLLLIDASFMFKNLEINKEYTLQELGL